MSIKIGLQAVMLPTFVQDKYDLSATFIGLIIAATPFSQIIVSSFVGKYVVKVGHKQLLLIGMCLFIIGQAGFIWSSTLIDDGTTYLWAAIMTKLFVGVGLGFNVLVI
mmetsp:Transcript_22891/g.16197  ORF Transcript_22891/g.16197 Transcript_22891/m.16197 type:complete len:108 (+) Transcript_22891:146-469(+)